MNADLLTRLQRRRRFLGGCTYGIGAIALANLINTDTPVKASGQQLPHHLPRARRFWKALPIRSSRGAPR